MSEGLAADRIPEPVHGASVPTPHHKVNYTAVFVELVALPLVHTAWITALLGSLAHLFVLRARVTAEDRVLLASPDYVARMGSKPRFFP